MLIAKGKLAVGNDIDAAAAITKVLNIDPRNEEGYILEAMIKNKRKEFDSALISLQEAISHNFKIRENPLFALIKGEIEFEMKDFVSAEMTMEGAISLPSIKNKQAVGEAKKYKVLSFTEKDRCAIFLLLAKCYAKSKKFKESKSIMEQAIRDFVGTSEEVNVLLTNALISIETGDIKKAISILKAVKSTSPYFVESRKMLADIHLTHLKSRKNYARCYYEVIETDPTF
jgi:tetratricopeptide repeat protein 21B